LLRTRSEWPRHHPIADKRHEFASLALTTPSTQVWQCLGVALRDRAARKWQTTGPTPIGAFVTPTSTDLTTWKLTPPSPKADSSRHREVRAKSDPMQCSKSLSFDHLIGGAKTAPELRAERLAVLRLMTNSELEAGT
jgi:hypothetical protein